MMKRLLFAAALAAAVASAPSYAQVGVSINVGQPGFYGRIDIGNVPQPQLIYAQPVLVQRVAVQQQPIYLNVPPGHEKKWSKHCYKYNACGQRVYFVQNSWYNNVYVPRYEERRGDNDNDHGNGHVKDKGHGKDRGHGKDKGHGKGHKED